MNVSTWSISNPIPPIALFLVLLLLGMVGFFRLPITEFPDIDLPIITVDVGQPGAAPSEISNQVVRPIETAVADIVGVRHITANATDCAASITVEFELETETETDRALNDVKDAVTSVRDDLPDAISEPLVQRLDVTGRPILTFTVADPTRSAEELS